MARTKKEPDEVSSSELVLRWLQNHQFDRHNITNVGVDRYRVNLYESTGELIRTSKLIKSFYLVVEDGVVKDRSR